MDPMAMHAFRLAQYYAMGQLYAVASPTCYKTQDMHTIEALATSYVYLSKKYHLSMSKSLLLVVQVTIASSSPKSSKFNLL